MYFHETAEWPKFKWRTEEIAGLSADIRFAQGKLLGRMSAMGFPLRDEALLTTYSLDVVTSSEIEGERLNPSQVRSSIARRMGIKTGGLIASNRFVDGVVELMADATQNFRAPVTAERLFAWHRHLFPDGMSGLYRIEVGRWRSAEMQVVSGGFGHERVHYQAPKPERVPAEMARFIDWIETADGGDTLVNAALAHLWFVSIHPFDDGNGRIARALTDLMLARMDASPLRFYSVSSQILTERAAYYRELEAAQHGDGDITNYLVWFLGCVARSVATAERTLGSILAKAAFFQANPESDFNARQIKMINLLFDGFEGKLTSGKWAKICKCSSDTALNDITALLRRGVLKKAPEGGRSVNYLLSDFRSRA